MIFVERLQSYTPEDAVGLGRLRPYLSKGKSDEPVDEAHLQHIIESPDHEQLVARLNESRRIVGAATLTIISGALTSNKGWLEDFVTDPNAGAKGIGQQVWNEMEAWCQERDVDLEFTSHNSREAAHNFYKKNGVETRETTVFKKHF
jgi:GNAT superfamily N-acetyltransferase